jgi:Zn finger protein HypA/HybF involved in hydrogenase expression
VEAAKGVFGRLEAGRALLTAGRDSAYSEKSYGFTLDKPLRFIMLVAKASHSCIRGADMQAYCLKCRTQREMKDSKAVTLKNGRPATQGICPVCGTKMFRIGKK